MLRKRKEQPQYPSERKIDEKGVEFVSDAYQRDRRIREKGSSHFRPSNKGSSADKEYQQMVDALGLTPQQLKEKEYSWQIEYPPEVSEPVLPPSIPRKRYYEDYERPAHDKHEDQYYSELEKYQHLFPKEVDIRPFEIGSPESEGELRKQEQLKPWREGSRDYFDRRMEATIEADANWRKREWAHKQREKERNDLLQEWERLKREREDQIRVRQTELEKKIEEQKVRDVIENFPGMSPRDLRTFTEYLSGYRDPGSKEKQTIQKIVDIWNDEERSLTTEQVWNLLNRAWADDTVKAKEMMLYFLATSQKEAPKTETMNRKEKILQRFRQQKK